MKQNLTLAAVSLSAIDESLDNIEDNLIGNIWSSSNERIGNYGQDCFSIAKEIVDCLGEVVLRLEKRSNRRWKSIVRRLSKKSKYLLDKLQATLELLNKMKDKKIEEATKKIEEDLNFFLEPKKARLFKLRLKKKKRKKQFKYKKGVDPKIVHLRRNGQKGGLKRAANHSREQLAEWGSKAGNTTLARYGKDFFKHIRAQRKTFGPRKKRKKQQLCISGRKR